MTFLPVVAREISALSRRRSTYLWRAGTALAAILVIGWLFLISLAGLSFARLGTTIFYVLSGISFAYALIVGVHATSDSLSEEKREGTLGLLFLTDLKGYDIVLGKVAATSLNAVYALIGLVPMLSFGLLLGGITLWEVGKISLLLANTMFLSLALGMFVSSISVNERKAVFAASVALSILTVGPFILAAAYSEMQRLSAGIIWLSPLYPYLCVVVPTGQLPGFHTGYFILAVVMQHLLGWALLFRAVSILPRFVHGIPVKFDFVRARLDAYVFGTREQRKAHRAALLDRNAFLWLAARERVKPIWAWVIVGIFFALYLWVAFGFGGTLFDLQTSCVILFLVHLILKFWVASEVCSRLIQDRRSGALELLLSSPLSVRQIAAGQSMALRRIFAKPLAVLIAAEVVLMFVPLNTREGVSFGDRVGTYFVCISSLLIDLWALKWVGLWLSLFGKSIERVLMGTFARVLGAAWLSFFGLAAILAALLDFRGERLKGMNLLWLWWICGVVFSLGFALPARSKFLKYFREIAANRYESGVELAKVVRGREEVSEGRRWMIPRIYRRHPVLNSIALAGLLTAIGVLGYRAYWSYQFEREVTAIRAQGLPTRIFEIPKVYPPVEREQNAFAMLQDAGMVNRMSFRGRTRNQPGEDLRNGLDPTNRASFAAIFQGNPDHVIAWRKVAQWRKAYFPPVTDYAYSSAPDLFGYLQVGIAELMLAYDEGDKERLKAGLFGTLQGIRLAREQPVMFAQLFSFNAAIRLTPVMEAAVYRGLMDDGQLLRLQGLAEEIGGTDVLTTWLAIDRALMLDPPVSMQAMMMGDADLSPIKRRFMEAVGVRQEQLTAVMRRYEEALRVVTNGVESRVRWAESLRDGDYGSEGESSALDVRGEGAIKQAIIADARSVAHGRVLQVAMAVERYFRRHGEYPQRLAALVPEFLAAVPIDPFSGQELGWSPTPDGAIVYSIGHEKRELAERLQAPKFGDISFQFWRRSR